MWRHCTPRLIEMIHIHTWKDVGIEMIHMHTLKGAGIVQCTVMGLYNAYTRTDQKDNYMYAYRFLF